MTLLCEALLATMQFYGRPSLLSGLRYSDQCLSCDLNKSHTNIGFFFLNKTPGIGIYTTMYKMGFPGGSVKNPPAMQETWVQSLGWEDPLEEGTATRSSTSFLENPRGQRSLAGHSPWACQELDTAEQLSTAKQCV